MGTAVTDRELTRLLPEGAGPPCALPDEIFQAALATYQSRRRLDMRALAAELGMGRSTLYRKCGSRDRLLGEVIWYVTRRAMARALVGAQSRTGYERVMTVVERFLRYVHGDEALHRFLDAEPEAALRVLTSRDGFIQQGIRDALERLLADEAEAGRLRLALDPATLAYVIVRIGEGFLYADVIADNEPDVEMALTVIGDLVREPGPHDVSVGP